MAEIWIATYVITNIIIIAYYLHKYKHGFIMPPFLAATISLSVMLPQMTTIYFDDYYDSSLLYNMGYTMVTCNIALAIGFQLGKRERIPNKITDIDLNKCQWGVFVFALLGIYSNFTSGDGVMIALFRSFAQFSIVFSLAYFLQTSKKYSIIYIIAIIIGISVVLHFIFFIYGSRGSSLFLFICISYFLLLKKPDTTKYIKWCLLSILLGGSIVSASISAFRENLHGANHEIEYWKNFTKAFVDSRTRVGMDLGNGAILLDYCYQHDSYNYGTIIWNGFVYNYVPERIFGKEFKESLQYHPDYEKQILPLTHGITTVTGYFEAFASFGFLGFILFGLIGFLLGIIWTRAYFSKVYFIVLIYSLGNIPLVLTHNLQYIFQRWEMILIFILPMFFFALKQKKIIIK